MNVYFAPQFSDDEYEALNCLARKYAQTFARDESTARVANHVDMCFSGALSTYLDREAPADCLGKVELAPLAAAGIDLADQRRQEDVLHYLTHLVCFAWRRGDTN